MAPLLRTSKIRWDTGLTRRLAADPSQTSSVTYGGFADRTTPQLPGDGVGYFHHPGSLAAMGIAARSPVGSQQFPLWEPLPGWNSPRALVRPARLVALLVDPAFVGDLGDRIDAAYPAFEELGVTVALVGGTAGLLPHAALVPARDMAVADATNPQPGTDPGVFWRLRPTYLDTAFVGGELMVAELNAASWTRGGKGTGFADGSAGSGYATTVVSVLPISAPAGGSLHTCGVAGARIVTFPAEALADLDAAARLAAGCERYGHYVYQADTPGSFGTIDLSAVDDAAIFAECTGGSGLVTRRVVSAADPDEIWATFRADALAFFAP